MTKQPVCLVLTRPLWQGAPDTLADELQANAGLALPSHWSLRVVSAPLQRLIPIAAKDLQRPAPLPLDAGLRMLVATSPASVEALGALPSTAEAIRAQIATAPGRWVLTGVGEASCSALVRWFAAQQPPVAQSAVVVPEVWYMPAALGSGAEPFLRWLASKPLALPDGADALLLEAQGNQPVLAEGLASLGVPSQRLTLYRREACLMPMISPQVAEGLGLVVSSSTLVDAAIAGLTAQAINPRGVVWMTHHPRIAKALTAALSVEIVPMLEGLDASQILSGLARLNFRV